MNIIWSGELDDYGEPRFVFVKILDSHFVWSFGAMDEEVENALACLEGLDAIGAWVRSEEHVRSVHSSSGFCPTCERPL